MNEEKAKDILIGNCIRYNRCMLYYDLDNLKNIKGDLKLAIDYLTKECDYAI